MNRVPEPIPAEARAPKLRENDPAVRRVFPWLGALLLAVAVFTRLRLLAIPFERDEGVFAYIGRALWSGKLLYTELYDNKLPGLYALYAVFVRVFSAEPWGIHLGALLLQVAAWVVFYRWLAPLLGRGYALLATGLWALYAASAQVAGFAAHATQLLQLPAIGGVALLWPAAGDRSPRSRAFAAGLLFGLAFCIKQQAFFYLLFAAVLLVARLGHNGVARLALTALGFALPIAAVAAWFAAHGRFGDFYFWTVELPARQAGGQGVDAAGLLAQSTAFVGRGWWGVWALAAVGLGWWWARPPLRVVLALLPLSLGAASIGGLFFPHYFVLALPWIAVAAAAGCRQLAEWRQSGGTVLAAALVLSPIAWHSGYWFWHSPEQILREVYGLNPFAEMAVIGQALRQRSAPDDMIAVIGSEPELYVYAGRPAAVPHLFLQGAVQPHRRQAAFARQYEDEFARNRPRFVVFPSALIEPVQNSPLVQNLYQQIRQQYHPVGTVEIYPDRPTVYRWDGQLTGAMPTSPQWVMVLERNE